MSSSGATSTQRLFDVWAAAAYLGRTPKAVEHLIARGVIPSTRMDGKIQIDRAKLDKVIEDKTYYEA
jgi:flagellar capping protein FliD